MKKGIISDIKRFAVHDGNGIRTTVFFKGCPLQCIWCHNPEGISFEKQLCFVSKKCSGCSECANICANHTFANGKHCVNFDQCIHCGKCIEACNFDALMIYGKEVTVEYIMSEVLKDRSFYHTSGGGITLSGGECLCQADFCLDLLKACKLEKINTAVDTCGYVPQSVFEKILPYTDMFLYDIKAIDDNVHRSCTGKSNEIILKNLKYIDSMGAEIEIRIPFVPDYNSDQIMLIYDFVKELKNVSKVRVLPYHNLAGSKYQSLNMINTLPQKLPDMKTIEQYQKMFDEFTDNQ